MDKDSAVLQGAFLLADKLCGPSSLSALQKADWSRVSHLILEALKEVSGQNVDGLPNQISPSWRKKIVCVVWLKLLCKESGEDVEAAWRQNPFFSLQNALPDVNGVVLLELVKSTGAAGVFAAFLLCFPPAHMCAELERLVEHVKSAPTTEDDVQLLLDVWWELWKCRCERKIQREGSTDEIFTNQLFRLFSESSGPNHQAKRLKLEHPELLESEPNVLYLLLHALHDVKDHIASTDLCYQALSVSLNALYTSSLIDEEVPLTAKDKLDVISKMICSREKTGAQLSPELIQEAQRDVNASHTPARFKLSGMTLNEGFKIVSEILQFCQSGSMLKWQNGFGPSYQAFQLEQSIQRIVAALDEREELHGEDLLKGLLKSLDLVATQSSADMNAKVASMIITHRLEDYESFAVLHASGTSSAACDGTWLNCIEKNQAAFRQHDALLALSATLRSKLHSESVDVSQCRKLMKIVTDVFSALEDKNTVLAAVLQSSSKGFFERPAPSAISVGFEQELNMAFNCIIQGGAVGASQGNLKTAVSLVARVAFQNPEAALRSCCHSAVFNKGAFSLMAAILQQLPGLKGRKSDDKGQAMGEGDLLCWCLLETVRGKSLSAIEKEQFVKFLGLLMKPERDAEGLSFVSPEEVVNTFVLPNISGEDLCSGETELSLQLLHAALSQEIKEEASPSPHWVMLCSPFPLLYILAQLQHHSLRFWEQAPEDAVHSCSMDTRELLGSVLTRLGQLVGAEVAADPSSWSRALFWLYNQTEELDWTVRFYLKPVWGEHFKNEVPSSLLAVCALPEQEWSSSDLPLYGPGTGLLAWMECCSLSDSLRSTMLCHLSLEEDKPEHVGMFSKGVLVALTQMMPWCSVSQWSRLLEALRQLITSARLHVPFSLEYVDYLPLLDLRSFSCELRLSVLLLRVLQLLCGSSCSHWLSTEGWAHVGRLYAHAVREIMTSLRAKQPLTSSEAFSSPQTPPLIDSDPSNTLVKPPKMGRELVEGVEETNMKVKNGHSQEVLFVLSQLYCHVQHIQVMMPGGQSEPLFLSCLDILSHYEAIMAAFPNCCSSVESDNTRHFFSTITDNLQSQEMKAVLQQKIAQLTSSAA